MRWSLLIVLCFVLLSLFSCVKSEKLSGSLSESEGNLRESACGKESINGIHVINWVIYRDGKDWPSRVKNVLDLDYVKGVIMYVSWEDFEPEEGQYRWEFFDEALKLAAERGKTASFSLLAAVQSPGWVMQQTNNFTYVHYHPSIGEVTAPVPWDEVYIAKLGNTVKAMARRYDGHPALHYVTINGPSTLFGVETNFPLKSISKAESVKLGYTHQKFILGWKQMVDMFFNNYTETQLSLGLHYDICIGTGGDEEKVRVAKKIRNYALLQQKNRRPSEQRLVVRLLGLGHGNKRYFPGEFQSRDKMNDYIALAWDVKGEADVGFEANRVFSRKNAGRAPMDPKLFLQVLKNGISYDAKWLEVKFPDVWDVKGNSPYAPYVSALKYADESLTTSLKN